MPTGSLATCRVSRQRSPAQVRGDDGDHTGHMDRLGEQERSIGQNRRSGNFDQVIVNVCCNT